MPLDPKQEKLLGRFFPGLIEAIRTLGQGDFEPKLPSIRPKGDDGIGAVNDLNATYFLSDGFVVEIRTSSRLKPGAPPYVPSDAPVDLSKWERTYYSLGYGPSLEKRVFAIDFDRHGGRHVHMLPDLSLHVAITAVIPNTFDLDPRDFVEMVRQYREKNIYPLTLRNP